MLYHTAPLHDAAVPHFQLQHFFQDQIKCVYKAEKELFTVLGDMQQAAIMEELKKAFADYSLQIQAQLLRLEEIFGIMLIEPVPGACESITGMIREMKRSIADARRGNVTRDAILVLSIRKAIYYKIAAYSALEMLADSQGMEEACNLLHLSLEEEKDSDMVLTDIAERRIKNL